jgi:hypothetical protein
MRSKYFRKLSLALMSAAVLPFLFAQFALADGDPSQATVQTEPTAQPDAPKPNKAADKDWHVAFSPYLWFAGIHGTVGALGQDSSVHASFGDIFKNLNMGLMGVVEPRYEKFSAPVDFMWMKLSDDKGLSFEEGPTSIKAKVNQTMLAPKIAYRVHDGKMAKVDANFGIRYFHLGTTLTFEPSGILPGTYQSANWVDYTGGARIQAALSPKMLVTILGDAGAGGANLDYQVAGLLGYRLKPNLTMQAGWRYLDVNYQPKSTFKYDVITSGLLLGVTFNLK